MSNFIQQSKNARVLMQKQREILLEEGYIEITPNEFIKTMTLQEQEDLLQSMGGVYSPEYFKVVHKRKFDEWVKAKNTEAVTRTIF